ncbi:cbb3-type cytochrome oxidase subunit 3 [Cruoricaptor ignavus]|uniref:cbb3-type cytochrome oxidase subunit 3 n=1 Tax=Cruoricaptor ignavus TaxID=1118202 RepID=UPI00370DACDA
MSNGQSLYQIIALLIFFSFFIALLWYVFSKPKKYYEDQAELPLDDDEKNQQL